MILLGPMLEKAAAVQVIHEAPIFSAEIDGAQASLFSFWAGLVQPTRVCTMQEGP